MFKRKKEAKAMVRDAEKKSNKSYPLHYYENKGFITSADARPLRILGEYLYPATIFKKENIQDTIVFFGSARIYPDKSIALKTDLSKPPLNDKSNLNAYSKYFKSALDLSFSVTKWAKTIKEKYNRNVCVITGGGGGIMEAANRGAKEAGGKSIGLNIQLPHEQYANSYISKNLGFIFHYFFMRKYWFLFYARALVVFPGGFGTLDELFETLTLVQTKAIAHEIKVILYGKVFWNSLINFKFMSETGLISKEDLNLIEIVDSVEEVMEVIKKIKLPVE